jgi:hypothetical protein
VDIGVKSEEEMHEWSPALKDGTFCSRISEWNLSSSTRHNENLWVLTAENKCNNATIPEKLIPSFTQLKDAGSFLKSW